MVFLFLDSVLDFLLKGCCTSLALKITFKMTAVDGAGEMSPFGLSETYGGSDSTAKVGG